VNLALNKIVIAGCQWLRPVTLATQEAEIRRIMVQSQPQANSCKTLSQKYSKQKRTGREVSRNRP
jgi:hypothetical protein